MENSSYKKNRPQLTTSEILNNKDFSSTLKNANPKGNMLLKSIKYWGTGAVATVVIVVTLLMFNAKTSLQNDSSEAEFTYQPSDKLSKLSVINPPLPNYDIAYEYFKVDCDKDVEITTKSGTTFIILKNSLIDVNGDQVTGIAEIRYREFRNPVDFFLSGIPMDYDSAGTIYTFESAGMLDIKAFQNDNSLQLSENKAIDFKFDSTTPDDGYNFYSLNEETGNWRLDDQNINVVKPQIKTKNNKVKKLNKDEETITLAVPVKQNKTKYSLNLAVNKDEYPELEKYQGTIFEINEGYEKFDPIIYKIQWENASLSDSEIKENYTLTLTREDSSILLTVYPVMKDEFYKDAIKQYHKEKLAYESVANTQDDFERYDTYVNVSINTEVRNTIIREFTIAGFGIYNCDAPKMRPSIIAKKNILDENLNRIKLNNYYVANPSKNAVVNLYPFNKKTNIRYYKKGASIVWFVAENGFISIINSQQFANINDIKHLNYEVFSPNQGIDILRDLMAYK